MLPAEAFAEAVAFLRLFDLSALLVANALCSSLALKASTAIQWQKFPRLKLYIANRWIDIGRTPSTEDEDGRWNRVAMLTFRSVDETAAFITAAFPNCVFDDVAFSASLRQPLMDAMDQVGDSVIINRTLRPPYDMSPADTLSFVQKFRKLKALLLRNELSGTEANETLCRESGVQEVHYYPVVNATLQEINSELDYFVKLFS